MKLGSSWEHALLPLLLIRYRAFFQNRKEFEASFSGMEKLV